MHSSSHQPVSVNPKKTWKLSPEQWDSLRSEYRGGATVATLAKKYGVAECTIREHFHKRGEVLRPPVYPTTRLARRKFTPEQDKQIAADYQGGKSSGVLAREYGESNVTILAAIKRGGASVRTPAEQPFRETTKKLTSVQKAELIQRWNRGEKISHLAERYGICVQSIHSLLRRRGIAKREFFTKAQKEEVVICYTEGESMKSIARRLDVSRCSIKRLLIRTETLMRSSIDRVRKYHLDESAFDDAENNPEAAYFVGLLMADGGICDPPGYSLRITLGLKISDAEQVERFRAFLKTDHPIVYRQKKDCNGNQRPVAYLTVSSNRLAHALARYGVVPRKSHTAKVSLLEENRFFWAGMIDGDGSLSFNKKGMPVLSLVGSRSCLEQFSEYIRPIAPECKAKVHKSKSIWGFITSGTPAVKLITHLYSDCPWALSRKKVRAEKAMKWQSSRRHGEWAWLTEENLVELYSRFGSWRGVARHLGIDRRLLRHYCRTRLAT